MKKVAIYPGTFDPITFGHLDIIRRAAQIFDHIIVAPAVDNYKNPLFSIDERVELINSEVKNLNVPATITVEKFEGLLIKFARKRGAFTIVRGLRAVSDFEHEFQMFGMNNKLDSEIQTIFLPASETNHFIASRLVKEVANLGGDISKFVSPNIADSLMKKLDQK
jgi:pantetheine-phosphate adenylyltransferase